MNNELRVVLFAYLEACDQEPKPKLEDWIKKYPQYREDLVRFAVYHQVVEQTALTDEEEEALVNVAMDIEQEALDQAFTDFSDPAPLTGIVARAKELNMSPGSLAASLNLAVDIILKLERRVLIPDSIPNTFLEQLAKSLYCGVAQLQAFLEEVSSQPSPTFYHAKQQPATGGKQSFVEAVRKSRMMSPEQKERWLKIAAQGGELGN